MDNNKPLLLAPNPPKKKENKNQLECCICQGTLHVPIQSCERHTMCYECCWRTCFIQPSYRDWNRRSVRFETSCPICKQNKIQICVSGDDTKVALRGIRRIPDLFVSQLFPENDYMCPFCPFSSDMVSLTCHVDRCPQRPLRCPSKLCKLDFTVEQGWLFHVRQDCKGQKCSFCEKRGSLNELQPHEETHALIAHLNRRLLGMSSFLKRYRFDQDPLYGPEFNTKLRAWLGVYSSDDVIFHIQRPAFPYPADRKIADFEEKHLEQSGDLEADLEDVLAISALEAARIESASTMSQSEEDEREDSEG